MRVMRKRTPAAPVNIGLLFDWHAGKPREDQTVVHLDRPLDVAPELGTTLDGETLATLVRQLSAGLYAAGLRHGDRLVVVKENHYDFVLTAAAAARLGALPVMMAPISSIEAIRTMVDRADPKVLVAGTTILARAAAAGIGLVGPDTPVIAVGGTAEGTLSFDELRTAPEAPVRVRGDREAMIVTHTSGTTGVPKLVVHSAYTALGALPYKLESTKLPLLTSSRSDVVASSISFAHMRGLSWTRSQLSIAPAGMVVISDPAPDNVERVLERHRPSALEALPNIFQRWEELADRRPELFSRVKRFQSTFDAIHPRTVRKFLGVSTRRFPVWAWGLGQSEIAGISANIFTRRTVRPGAREDATGLGWPTLVRVKLVDPQTMEPVAKGPGLILVKTNTRCLDYLGESDRHELKVRGPWWNTGDLGERAGFGRIRMVDREVDLIPGMSCIEVESTLLDRLDRAAEVVVLGSPDSLPLPVLCMREDRLEPGEWERATAGLPQLAEPRIVRWEDVPRTATWKVRRVELRERLLGMKEGLGTGQWT